MIKQAIPAPAIASPAIVTPAIQQVGLTGGKITEMQKRRDVAGLIQALGYKDSGIRGIAADALGEIGDARAIDPLIAGLNDKPSYHLPWAATKALAKFGSPAVERLIGMMKDRTTDAGNTSVEALGKVGKLLEDDALRVRCMESLIEVMKDEDKKVRQDAALALGQIGARLENAALRARTVEQLIDVSRDEDNMVRQNAVWALGETSARLGDDALRIRTVERLFDALKDEDNKIRQNAVTALGWMSASLKDTVRDRTVGLLIAALKDKDPKVCKNSAESLGKIGAQQAFEPLMEIIDQYGGDKSVKEAAVTALGSLGDARAYDVLTRLLNNQKLNAAAATGLGDLGDRRAVEPLLNEFKHYLEGTVNEYAAAQKNIRVVQIGTNYDWASGCMAIAGALGKIGDARAVKALGEALKYEANLIPDVERSITFALELLKKRGQ
jgi:HEAT repeat protein